MLDNKLANSKLGIKAQAWSILALLENKEPSFADYKDGHYMVNIDTYPWYNGRETGFAIVLSKKISGKCLVVVFSECRNSDQIFVDKWVEEKTFFNRPTVDNFTEEAYKNRVYFPFGCVGEAVGYIYNEMGKFYESEK